MEEAPGDLVSFTGQLMTSYRSHALPASAARFSPRTPADDRGSAGCLGERRGCASSSGRQLGKLLGGGGSWTGHERLETDEAGGRDERFGHTGRGVRVHSAVWVRTCAHAGAHAWGGGQGGGGGRGARGRAGPPAPPPSCPPPSCPPPCW